MAAQKCTGPASRLDAFGWHGGAERMFTVELYAGIRRAVRVDGLSRRKAASFDAGLRQPDDVRGQPEGRKKGA